MGAIAKWPSMQGRTRRKIVPVLNPWRAATSVKYVPPRKAVFRIKSRFNDKSDSFSLHEDEDDLTESPVLGESESSSQASKEREITVICMGSAAFAAFSFEDITKKAKQLRDRVYFGSGDYLPIIGTLKISYGRLMQLLLEKKVKRIYMMADGQVAIVEVPFETHASDYSGNIRYDKNDLSVMYIDQKPEWKMEKMRYYCELPGDIWEDGTFLRLVKRNQYHHDENNRMKYDWILKENQVTCELVMMDPSDSYVFLNEFIGQFIPIACLFVLRGVIWVGEKVAARFGRKKKDPKADLIEQYTRPRVVEFNIGDDENKNDTGIRFEDVAGIDKVKEKITEVLKIIRGDERYRKIGARAPKGIMLEGPPGTGKTYLAKAMAGEGGMPFYSCNGAEFVEMFSGIAAARIRNLFKIAREKAPSIIFIDEIDAIGKRRGGGGGGTSERESGLMQMLVEMDGARDRDNILVIGATNRIGLLDPALMRPGRFDVVIYMGPPSEQNRLKILKVHSKTKPVGKSPEETEFILQRAAKLTLGYSGADLANLLNEAAILSVRVANLTDANKSSTPVIEMFHMREAIEKVKLGLPGEALPDSKAKKFLITVQAGRAVALCTTPGLPEVDTVTTRPQGNILGRILFKNREYGTHGDKWHQLVHPGYETNLVQLDRPLSMFEVCSALLVPLFAGRATEEVLYGEKNVTLSSSDDISTAGDLAHYLVASSNLHPAFRHIPMRLSSRMGGRPDPTLKYTNHWFERYSSHIQEVAYQRTKRVIEMYRPAIERVADRLFNDENEILDGAELLEIIKSTPLAEPTTPDPEFNFEEVFRRHSRDPSLEMYIEYKGYSGCCSFSDSYGEVSFERPIQIANFDVEISAEAAKKAAAVIVGTNEVFSLLTSDISDEKMKQVLEIRRKRSMRNRLETIRRFSVGEIDDLPPLPLSEGKKGEQKEIYDTLRQGAVDPIEMIQDFDFWRNRKGAARR